MDKNQELRCVISDLMDQNKALRTQLTQQAEMVEKCMVAMNANADEVDRLKGRLAALAEPSEAVAEVAGDYNTKHIIFLPAGIALEVGDKLFTHPASKPEPSEPDCSPNHLCNGRMVHLPNGEQCDKCGETP